VHTQYTSHTTRAQTHVRTLKLYPRSVNKRPKYYTRTRTHVSAINTTSSRHRHVSQTTNTTSSRARWSGRARQGPCGAWRATTQSLRRLAPNCKRSRAHHTHRAHDYTSANARTVCATPSPMSSTTPVVRPDAYSASTACVRAHTACERAHKTAHSVHTRHAHTPAQPRRSRARRISRTRFRPSFHDSSSG
jgi:hypothetical protein